MSFLAPLYLLGMLAVALPVVFHLVRRTTRHRVPFGSLMFLRVAPPRLTKRSRLEDVLLLVLRGLLLVLLALAFARPFVKAWAGGQAEEISGKRLVILLDTSASMRRDAVWSEAVRRAVNAVEQASPHDRVAIIPFDRQPRVLWRFEDGSGLGPGERAAAVKDRLSTLQPRWAETRLDRALIMAAELGTDEPNATPGGVVELVVVTDLQRGARISGLDAFEWPDRVVVRFDVVEPARPGNAYPEAVADRRGLSGDVDPVVRVRIRNGPDADQEQFQLGWVGSGNQLVDPIVDAYVPAGQSRVVSLPLPTEEGVEVTRIRLLGDAAPFDNTLYLLPPKPRDIRIVYVGDESEDDAARPLFFLRRAFVETPRLSVRVDQQPVGQAVTPDALTGADLMVATGRLSTETARSLADAVRAGGTLLFAPNDVNAAQALSMLSGRVSVAVEEADVTEYRLLGAIDFDHGIMAPFAGPAFSNFAGIHFWRHRLLTLGDEPGARVIARFDNQDPAFLEWPVGEGRLYVLASGWAPADSQLALSSKFVPLLFSLLETATGGLEPPPPIRVGDALTTPSGAETVVERPDGTRGSLPADEGVYPDTDQPGIYGLVSAGASREVAVNIASAESRTEPLAPDELAQRGVPFVLPDPDPEATQQRAVEAEERDVEARQRGWRWLVAAALAVAMVETGLAGRATRRARVPTEDETP